MLSMNHCTFSLSHPECFVSLIIRQYVGKADFLVFRAMNQHGFLGQLQEKKLVSVQMS